MHARIEQDKIGTGREGRTFSSPDAPPTDEREYPVVLYLYDDDHILYYVVGCSDADAAEWTYGILAPGVGCTHSTIRMSRSSPAQPFIG